MASAPTRPAGQQHTARDGARARIPTFPAPKQLAVPTDLKPNEAQAVVEAVNPLIADAFALYAKTKNYHWHLSGSHFRDFHLLLDEHADAIFDAVDPLAERVRRIGGTTLRSITHVSQLQTIADDNDEFVPPAEMMRRLLADNQHIAEAQRGAIEICERNRDSVTANLLQEVLDQTEKRIWFLFEIVQGAGNTD
ncbi:MAG TPA: DNA starvation/stationary phase protection protein [Ktedonobacterales bacterium]|nr:DNA starvation/stationary phase protection protein [Ktedonobacterales bacterium]